MGIGDDLHWLPKSSGQTLQLVLLLLGAVCVAAQTDPCQANNAGVPADFKLNFTTTLCLPVWNEQNYVLRFRDNGTTLSVVLSVKRENRWYGIGFGQDGLMIKSSAMVAWVDETTTKPTIKQYILGNKIPSAVKIDNSMKFTEDPQVHVTADTLFMAFQIDKVKTGAAVSLASQIYAFGGAGSIPTSSLVLNQHESVTSRINFDYTSGASTAVSDPSSLRKNHGILNILGWGLLLPFGTIIARYGKQWDPAWFYLHVGFQITGYIFINVALVMGIALADKILDVDFNAHKAIGIVLFVFAALQISAVLIRPKKDAKIRKWWNYYHHWAGRIALIVAALNVFIGIRVSDGAMNWKAGYGFLLAFELVLVVILELFLWKKIRREKEPTLQLGRPPQFDTYNNNI